MALDPSLYEKLGVFYLGRVVDPASGDVTAEPVLYPSKDLTTHGVILGMTGSGKTGLGVGLLEEAAIDGIPTLILDPKGDMANLLLAFPELAASDFEPWVDRAEAERKGVPVADFAAAQAKLWSEGLAEWGQDGERVRRFREAARAAVYTPGSEAGRPLSILGSFRAPEPAVREDSDLLGDRIETLVGALLGLLEIDADPVTSREHILLSNLLADAWREGRDLDLAGLIQAVQEPGIDRIGVMDLETFYPAKERFKLAMRVNNLLASPGMAGWLAGEPLDVDRLLYTAEGKPRMSILSIAHLSESERMFFVSLLLAEVVAWVRSRPGTSSLRALLYMDEVFGFLPPVAEPPSKKPFLTLLKQARAHGLGLVLATQNPADLDYKALSNAGTWMLGRLQTERDKARVLDGLEGASGGRFDRGEMERLLAGLGKRTFLLHSVHEDEPVLFRTRWVLSYLRGPMTRQEIRRLSEETGGVSAGGDESAAPSPGPRAGARDESAAPSSKAASAGDSAGSGRPLLPPEVPQTFLLPRRGVAGDEVTYHPALLGLARLHFLDRKREVTHDDEGAWLAEIGPGGEVDWSEARHLSPERFDPDRDRDGEPLDGAAFAELPDEAASPRAYKGWEKDLSDALYRDRQLEIFESPLLDVASRPGEDERAFRIRLADRARERRDEAMEELRRKYDSKLDTQEARVRRAEDKVEREEEQVSHQRKSTLLSLGETAFGVLFGRKALSRTNLRKATSAARSFSRSGKEKADVERAEDELEAQRAALAELQEELEADLAKIGEAHDPHELELETVVIRPRRVDVDVREVSLAWVPRRGGEPAW